METFLPDQQFKGKKLDAILVFWRALKLKKTSHSSSVNIIYNIFLGLEVLAMKIVFWGPV